MRRLSPSGLDACWVTCWRVIRSDPLIRERVAGVCCVSDEIALVIGEAQRAARSPRTAPKHSRHSSSMHGRGCAAGKGDKDRAPCSCFLKVVSRKS